MTLFNEENTTYYTQEEREAINDEWDYIVETLGLEPGTEEYDQEAKAFCDAIARR